ncbi:MULTISPECIES: phosphatidylglycerophosphatase A family protein [Desulfococcus]|jgi:phosphatidylglycerophosphatase A|uniref:Phosphatidylglycerophosphatase A n=1 Tax=Desulfococcus multivorans DSM 2059 TaxID=1121405 RepID=S7TQG0_DESML|nr:phosphatidylglycerophosphatase A [Desulfococcus multivorans]AOY60285.1 PgpA: predicted phosphatidylglycerophosphatase A [Desulfococcus multivorans]AQV02396.1 phosphatidylglycerophosphatase A [Desulfococcus multivorans]EPR39211.1 phosphatidylglycerophosphatase A [Desulfococcus multivorans DSM 2059]SJZ57892.1 phosphatidylglycerophosphatase A [Desulfococcus multivorans DSM 2059]
MNIPEKPKHKIAFFVGSACGLGLSPVLPGTCGALLGVVLHAAVVLALPASLKMPMLLTMFAAVCAANHLLTPWAEAHWGVKDPPHFVLDEVAGYLLIPILFREGNLWPVAVWGFVLFRILDIFKLLPPARLIDEQLGGPWGVLLDDLVSAGYAAWIMAIVYWMSPELFV